MGTGAGQVEFRFVRHGIVDSTSECAFRALEAGEARHGDVHVAAGQTTGRGRRGARWVSPEGTGVYASVVLLPESPPPHPAVLTLAASLAVREALAGLGLHGTRLKWPNDLELDSAKLAGVLVETRGFDARRPHFVIGLGVNVRQRSFPPELIAERAVTSLALCAIETEPALVLERVLAQLGPKLSLGFGDAERLAEEFLAATGLAGSEVRVSSGSGSIAGRLSGLSLRRGVELDSGQTVPLEHVRGIVRA
jgi:BirA family biotin operon repressor/biotin-[acetyl-CoA-carboxylase] ligase